MVTILRSYTENGAYLPVSTSSPDIVPAVNPETTGPDGVFHWDVSAGYYKVAASATGCTVPGSSDTTAVIGPYPVPPPQLGLTITLQCADEQPMDPPAVTGLSQSSGPPGGGTVTTVLGTNFTPSSTVAFGTTAAAAVTYLSPQALSVTTPSGAGLVDVEVTTADGTSATTSADQFFFGTAPTVTNVSPTKGPVTGGTTVKITGTGFSAVTGVTFGGIPAKSFSVKSATSIVAVTTTDVAGPAAVQASNPAGTSAPAAAATFSYLAPVTAYVATGTGVIPLSIATGQMGAIVAIAGAAGVATTPDGQTVYVTSGNGVTPISTSSGQAGGTVAVGTNPGAIAVAPGGNTAYVANYGSGTVTPVSTLTSLPGTAIRVGSKPDAVAITPNGKTAYVANYGSNTITPITITTGKPGKPIKVGSHPDAIAITPNGKTAYVAAYSAGTLVPITISTGRPGKAITVGKNPKAVTITP